MAAQCKTCGRKFTTVSHLNQHYNYKQGLSCRVERALIGGNGNVLPLRLGDGAFGHPPNALQQAQQDQVQRAKRRKLNEDLLGPYSNCNLIRLKVDFALSDKFISEFMSVVLDPRWNPLDITAKTPALMKQELDQATNPILNTQGMIKKTVELGGQSYRWYVVDNASFEAVLLVTNSRLKGSLHYDSKRNYVPGHDQDPDFRTYGEPWTGTRWEEIEARVKLKFGNHVKILAVSIHIDGTVVMGLGKGSQQTYVTVSMTLCNFTEAARAANLKLCGNRVPICYLPLFIPDPKASHAKNFKNERLLNQIVLQDLFKSFEGDGIVYDVVDADKTALLVVPRLFITHQDLSEYYKRFQLVSGTCPNCMCPKHLLADCTVTFPPRLTCAEAFEKWEQAQGNKTERVATMDYWGIKEFPFWGWSHTQFNVYGSHAFDMLHIVDKTVTGEDLYKRCLTGALLGQELDLSRQQIIDHLQARNNSVKRLPYFQCRDSTHNTKYYHKGIKLGDDAPKWGLGDIIWMEGYS